MVKIGNGSIDEVTFIDEDLSVKPYKHKECAVDKCKWHKGKCTKGNSGYRKCRTKSKGR